VQVENVVLETPKEQKKCSDYGENLSLKNHRTNRTLMASLTRKSAERSSIIYEVLVVGEGIASSSGSRFN
jgi:hypothetical protein